MNANHSAEFQKKSSATIFSDKYNGITTFDELIEAEHGKIGTDKRNVYEQKAQMFIISEMLKETSAKQPILQV